jgi:hypothetical protein
MSNLATKIVTILQLYSTMQHPLRPTPHGIYIVYVALSLRGTYV